LKEAIKSAAHAGLAFYHVTPSKANQSPVLAIVVSVQVVGNVLGGSGKRELADGCCI
jgi:hypothetical protein